MQTVLRPSIGYSSGWAKEIRALGNAFTASELNELLTAKAFYCDATNKS
jgi:hypothetical protein